MKNIIEYSTNGVFIPIEIMSKRTNQVHHVNALFDTGFSHYYSITKDKAVELNLWIANSNVVASMGIDNTAILVDGSTIETELCLDNISFMGDLLQFSYGKVHQTLYGVDIIVGLAFLKQIKETFIFKNGKLIVEK